MFRLSLATAAATLGLVASAQARTYCVDRPDCGDGTVVTGPTPSARLTAALAAADGHAGQDEVLIGPGRFTGPFVATKDEALFLRGAGRDQTFLDHSGSTPTLTVGPAPTGDASRPPVAVDSLEIDGGPGQPLDARYASVVGVDLRSTGSAGSTTNGSQLTDVDAEAQVATVDVAGTLPTRILRLRSRGPLTLQGPAEVRRSTIDGKAASVVVLALAALTIEDSVLTGGNDDASLLIASQTAVRANHLTAVTRASTQRAAQLFSDSTGPARLELHSSVVSDVIRSGANAAAGTFESFGSAYPATITAKPTAHDDDVGPLQVVSAADPRPAPGSNLIDRGEAVGFRGLAAPLDREGDLDVEGRPRFADGDADGAARRDIGAYEVQAAAVPLPAGNLVVNPGADGPTPWDGGGPRPAVPGWDRAQGEATYAAYGAVGSVALPATAVGVALGAGPALFAGQSGPGDSILRQTSTLPPGLATAADEGRLTATYGALLGGTAGGTAAASLQLGFSGATSLGQSPELTVSPAERADAATLLPRAGTVAVPAGTRTIGVSLAFSPETTSARGLADDVALTLTETPKPKPPQEPQKPVEPDEAKPQLVGWRIASVGSRRADGRFPVKLQCARAVGQTRPCKGRLTVRVQQGKTFRTLAGGGLRAVARGKGIALLVDPGSAGARLLEALPGRRARLEVKATTRISGLAGAKTTARVTLVGIRPAEKR